MKESASMFSLQGKVALVTGATSGIGRRQAEALSAAGATIIAVGRDADRLELLMQELPGTGLAVQCDLATADLSDTFKEVIANAGGVDILCNLSLIHI